MYRAQTDTTAIAEPLARLIDELAKLPGIGPKTAQRLAFFILRQSPDDVRMLARAIAEVKERIGLCSICFNFTEHDPCVICANPGRDRAFICVVEQPLDVIALERTHGYHGLYHVLHGAISPMDGIGPDQLKIDQLEARVLAGGMQEVILATNPNMEGDATAMYLTQRLSRLGVRVTQPARGLPMGGDLEFADDVTLKQAMDGRREFR